MKKVFAFIVSIFLMLTIVKVHAVPTVLYDNFNITESNHVKMVISLKTLDKSNIKITGKDASKIKIGKYNNWYDKGVSVVGTGLYYEGPISFGSETSTAKTSVDAVIELRFNDAAMLYDGKKADVLMTISDIEFNVRGLGNTSLNPKSNYDMLIALSQGDSDFWLLSEHPQTKVLTNEKYENLTEDERLALSAMSNTGNSYKVNIKVLKKGTNTPIDDKYKNLAFGMSDIDATDKTVSTSNIDDDAKKIITQGTGKYNEGVELIEGFNNVVHFATSTPLAGYNITEQSVLKTMTGSHNGLKIVVDANKISNNKIRPNNSDDNTYYSGFVTMAYPQNFTFYWTGASCGSQLFTPQDAIVNVKHNLGGVISTKTYGSNISFTEIDKWEKSFQLINSTSTYTFNSQTGYYLANLKIDGKEIEIPSNFKYTFDSLVYNPLVRLNEDSSKKYGKNGEIEYLIEPHSIEAKYAPNSFTVVYENGGGKDGALEMSNGQGVFGEIISLSKNEFAKEGYKFDKWEVYYSDIKGNRTNYLNSNGNQVYFKDGESISGVLVEDGGSLIMVAIWKEKWIHKVNFGVVLLGSVILLTLGLIVFIIYKMKAKDKFNMV